MFRSDLTAGPIQICGNWRRWLTAEKRKNTPPARSGGPRKSRATRQQRLAKTIDAGKQVIRYQRPVHKHTMNVAPFECSALCRHVAGMGPQIYRKPCTTTGPSRPQQLVIVSVSANPVPRHSIAFEKSECSIVVADTNRVDRLATIDTLEAQRVIARIIAPKLIGMPSSSLFFRGKLSVKYPELFGALGLHR